MFLLLFIGCENDNPIIPNDECGIPNGDNSTCLDECGVPNGDNSTCPTVEYNEYLCEGDNCNFIEGYVQFIGDAPNMRPLTLNSDPYCEEYWENIDGPYSESFLLNDNGYLQNAIVWIERIDNQPIIFDNSNIQNISLNIEGCIHVPRIIPILLDQPLIIHNNDLTLVNVHSMSTINPEFNYAMPPGISPLEQIFYFEEEPFYVKDDVHPWVKSWIQVFNHPYFAVTDENGYFKIENIPTDVTYRVVLWQERLFTELPESYEEYNSPYTSFEISNNYYIFNYSLSKPIKKDN